ncbi:MAG: glycosyltransferase [Candidatus Brocadiaceae bacterium]
MITFIGNQTLRRKSIFIALEKYFKVFISNIWDSKKLNEIFNESKIVLNIHLSDLLNIETRIGEVLGSGSFLLTEELPCQDLFIDGEHLVQWRQGDVEDLIKKIQYYLIHEDEREKIAEKGHRFAIEHHSFEKRMHQLLSTIDFNKNKTRTE